MVTDMLTLVGWAEHRLQYICSYQKPSLFTKIGRKNLQCAGLPGRRASDSVSLSLPFEA